MRQLRKKNINFNPSLFYIKNSTGELLLFKTQKQPAFNELQAEEVSELEFDNGKENLLLQNSNTNI